MTEITQVKLDEMLAGLEGVTPGPWKMEGSIYEHMGAGIRSISDDRGFAQLWKSGHVALDAAHIARCDPETMRALIALASQALRSQGELRYDLMCNCVGTYGPNPECGRCGGSGCYTGYTHPAPQEAGEVKVTGAMVERIVDALSMAYPHTLEFDAESGGYYDTDLSREISALLGAIPHGVETTNDEAFNSPLSTLTEGSSR